MAVVELTETNFKKEVLEEKLPVLVDFWAEWCVAPDSRVSLNRRDSISANEILKGQRIVSFSKKKEESEVSYSRLISNEGHCRLVKTENGREIRVTDNHRFWGLDGWKTAKELSFGDRVAVFPSIEFLKSGRDRTIVVDEAKIRQVSLPRMRTERYVKELGEKNLLPLKADNPKMLILARLVGFCLTDGSLYQSEKNNYREVSFSVGQENDVESLREDFLKLGFSIHVKERVSLHEIGGRKFKMHTFKVKCLSSAFWLLFRAMGVPEGNKTNQVYALPDWIFKVSRLAQREFLAGFLGGDGPRVTITEKERKNKNSYNKLNINDLEFYKREDLADSGLSFAWQLTELMAEFGVRVVKVFVKEAPYKQKDGTQTKIIHLKFRQDFETGYALTRRIGYAYCSQKATVAVQVGEFLGKILTKRKKWQKIYQEAIKLEKEKELSPSEIANDLNVSEGAVWGWLKYNRKPTIKKHFEKYPQWLNEARKGLPEGFFWDVVEKVESIYLPAVQRLMVDKNHNFIANEFVVHNCGPCRLVGPVIEELAKEYHDKIKVGKLNVDENPKTTQQYRIMSIPTMIIFKEGKEVARKVGLTGKEELISLIG